MVNRKNKWKKNKVKDNFGQTKRMIDITHRNSASSTFDNAELFQTASEGRTTIIDVERHSQISEILKPLSFNGIDESNFYFSDSIPMDAVRINESKSNGANSMLGGPNSSTPNSNRTEAVFESGFNSLDKTIYSQNNNFLLQTYSHGVSNIQTPNRPKLIKSDSGVSIKMCALLNNENMFLLKTGNSTAGAIHSSVPKYLSSENSEASFGRGFLTSNETTNCLNHNFLPTSNSTGRENNSSISNYRSSNGAAAASGSVRTTSNQTTNSQNTDFLRLSNSTDCEIVSSIPNVLTSICSDSASLSRITSPIQTSNSPNNEFLPLSEREVFDIQSLNWTNSTREHSVAGMASGTSADIKTNNQGRYSHDAAVASSESHKPNNDFNASSPVPDSGFPPLGLPSLPSEKMLPNENVKKVSSLELIKAMLEEVRNKANDPENPFEIAFNSSCGENYEYDCDYLHCSLIRDVVSGGLCSGMIRGFTFSDSSVLLGITRQSEKEISDFLNKLISYNMPKTVNESFFNLTNILLKRFRKLITANCAYMRYTTRRDANNLRLYADEVKAQLFTDCRCENVCLGFKSYPPDFDKGTFIAIGIVKSGLLLLCKKHSELMKIILSNSLLSTHHSYSKKLLKLT